ncbi:unnamed protein product [Effrenium voratum]|nr:unnamed protein product [Effrenium voratum]
MRLPYRNSYHASFACQDPSMMQFSDVKGDSDSREKVVSIVLGEVTLLLCNLKEPQKPTELAFQPKYGTIKAYAWCGDGYLVVGFSQGYIVVLSPQREISEEVSSVKYHRNTLDSLCVSKAAGKIASAGDDGIKIISMKDSLIAARPSETSVRRAARFAGTRAMARRESKEKEALSQSKPGKRMRPSAGRELRGMALHGALWEELGQGRQVQEALRGARLRVDVVVFTAAIAERRRSAEWSQALSLLGTMGHHFLQPNVVTYNTSLGASRWSSALLLLRKTAQFLQTDVITCNTFLGCLSSAKGKWPLALAELGGIEPDIVTCNSLITSCERSAQWRRAIAFSEMAEADVVSYSAAVRCQRWPFALQLLADAASAAVQLNLIAYNAAASVTAARWRRVLQVLRHICRNHLRQDIITLNAAITSTTSGAWRHSLLLLSTAAPVPTVVSFNGAISSCEKAVQWQRAALLFEALHHRSTVSFGAVISAFEKAGRWQQAVALWEDAPEVDLILCNALISACEKAGQWRQALHILERVHLQRLQLDDVISFNSAISACEKAICWPLAFDLLRELQAHALQPTVITYNSVLSALRSGGSWAGGRAVGPLLAQMREARLAPDAATYEAAVESLGGSLASTKSCEAVPSSHAVGGPRSVRKSGVRSESQPADLPLLSFCTEAGWVYCFLAKLTALSGTCNTRLAYLTSLREMTVIEGINENENKVVINTDVEPAFVALGPSHLAPGTGMNNRIWFYSCTDQSTAQCVNEQEYIGSVESVSLNSTHACVLIDAKSVKCDTPRGCFAALSGWSMLAARRSAEVRLYILAFGIADYRPCGTVRVVHGSWIELVNVELARTQIEAPLRVGLVGLGSIGQMVAQTLTQPDGQLPNVALGAVLVQRERPERPPELGDQALLTTSAEAFMAADWSLCVEAAGQPWVRSHGREVLAQGRDLLVTSVGVFTDDKLMEDFSSVAASSGSRLLLPAGAMPGLDWMSSAALDEVQEVTVEQRKRPEGWRGTPAESRMDLAALTEPQTVFEGPAREASSDWDVEAWEGDEAASQFPKNANIAAALALGTVGLDRLTVRLVADPTVLEARPTSRITLKGACGELAIEVKGKPLSQRTSRIVPFSVLKALKNLSSPEDDRSITCATIVGNFLIYAHSNGRLQYYSLVDGQEVNEYKHSNGIRKCYPNHEGTRVALIDTSGTAWLYNPVNDDCIQIADFPVTADRILWDSSDSTIFVACDQAGKPNPGPSTDRRHT